MRLTVYMRLAVLTLDVQRLFLYMASLKHSIDLIQIFLSCFSLEFILKLDININNFVLLTLPAVHVAW